MIKFGWHRLDLDPTDLPDNGIMVLVSNKYNYYYIGWYDLDRWVSTDCLDEEEIIAWSYIEPVI